MKNLLTIGDAKTSKGEKLGYKTAILYMAPHKQNSFGKNLCAFATVGCAAACLYTAGRGKFSNVQKARIKKADYFLTDQKGFLISLIDQITTLKRKFENKLVIRLNGTSDIPYQNLRINNYNIFELFPNIQFYDYTKDYKKALNNNLKNYHLTYSISESDFSKYQGRELLKQGKNVALVVSSELYKYLFKSPEEKQYIYSSFGKINLLDGDKTDLRFLDSPQSIVILKAKGEASKDTSGFVFKSIDQLLNFID